MKIKILKFFLVCIFFQSLFASDIIFIGIAGGSGSGKTTLANKIHQQFLEDSIIISQDNYYKPLSSFPLEAQGKINFDHPDAIDFLLLKEHLLQLKEGKGIDEPIYDFITSDRKKETISIMPKKIIILEGVLIFTQESIRDLLDIKIYVDTDSDIRLLRRIERDIKERGRSFEGIKTQYLESVHPMHLAFVEPSKKYADFIVPRGGENQIALDLIISHLKQCMH
ncbi:MAG: uridine kinase [Chlamydiae bacterium]|nr:uridine kinase [Chlamydiota bacterium]